MITLTFKNLTKDEAEKLIAASPAAGPVSDMNIKRVVAEPAVKAPTRRGATKKAEPVIENDPLAEDEAEDEEDVFGEKKTFTAGDSKKEAAVATPPVKLTVDNVRDQAKAFLTTHDTAALNKIVQSFKTSGNKNAMKISEVQEKDYSKLIDKLK